MKLCFLFLLVNIGAHFVKQSRKDHSPEGFVKGEFVKTLSDGSAKFRCFVLWMLLIVKAKHYVRNVSRHNVSSSSAGDVH